MYYKQYKMDKKLKKMNISKNNLINTYYYKDSLMN